jgi:hypothetical protein
LKCFQLSEKLNIFIMRINLLLTFIILIFTLSCKKIGELTTFNIHNSTNFTVSSAIGINTPFNIPVNNIKTSSNQAFKNNNTRVDLVKDVKLTKLDLAITSPQNASFGNLKSISIYLKAEGLPEKLIAFKDNISNDQGSNLSLETTDERLDDYIKKEAYNLRTEVVMRSIYGSDVDVKADMTFRVTANLIN